MYNSLYDFFVFFVEPQNFAALDSTIFVAVQCMYAIHPAHTLPTIRIFQAYSIPIHAF